MYDLVERAAIDGQLWLAGYADRGQLHQYYDEGPSGEFTWRSLIPIVFIVSLLAVVGACAVVREYIEFDLFPHENPTWFQRSVRRAAYICWFIGCCVVGYAWVWVWFLRS